MSFQNIQRRFVACVCCFFLQIFPKHHFFLKVSYQANTYLNSSEFVTISTWQIIFIGEIVSITISK